MKRIVLIFLLVLSFFLVVIWLPSSYNKSKKAVLKVNRFEKELFSINAETLFAESNKWNKNFGSFNDVFTSKVIQSSQLDKDKYYNELLAFTQNKDMREAYDSTVLCFADFFSYPQFYLAR